MLNNFNSVLEIVSGLNHFAVQRLKLAWEAVSEKSMRDFQALDELMSSKNNFKNYQEELKTRKPPSVPYIGLFMRDFTYLAENPCYRASDGSVDFDLMRLIAMRLLFLQNFQSDTYKLQATNAANEFLNNMRFESDEDVLYQHSLTCQPVTPTSSGVISVDSN